MQNMELIAIFMMALSMSLAHCVGMCGGIVIAYSSSKINAKSKIIFQILSHLLYSVGRISSYFIIGIISALIGKGFSVSMTAKGAFFIFVGIILIIFAFSYIFFPKMMVYLEPSMTKGNGIVARNFRNIFKWFVNSKNISSLYGVGVLNGFLPCGMVYYFALQATLSDSILMGGIKMVVFGIATIPALFVLGFVLGKLKGISKYTQYFRILSFILMFGFGVYGIYNGISILQGKGMHMMHIQHSNMNHSMRM